MPAPLPLTACDPPQLDWSRPAAPSATDYDDIYFSVDGGLEETETVFLEGCGLPEGWQGRETFAIGELGFGSGLNFLAAWRLWEQSGASGHLHFISFEKFPFSKDELRRAHVMWPELSTYSARLADIWPGRVKGLHRLHLTEQVTLTLIHDDVLSGLQGLEAKIDAWFLDGFSPAKNPDMWSPEVMTEIASLTSNEGRLATFTVAGAVRSALTQAGFEVEKKVGYGRKRHRLEATFNTNTSARETQERDMRPVIIGAGIAGASLAKAFKRRGITPTIIDPDDRTAGSGNPAAIIKPRLDLQDRPVSRFYLASYLYAREQYRATGAVISEGIHHIAKSDDEVRRYEKFKDQGALPSPHIMPRKDGVYFGGAIVVDPKIIRDIWLEGTQRVAGKADRFELIPDGYNIFDEQGEFLASGSHVFLCAGFGIRQITQGDDLDLRYARGQLTWAHPIEGFSEPLTYGGYGLPLKNGVLVGTTHARVTMENPFETQAEDDESNLKRLSQYLEKEVVQSGERSRASVRVNTKTTQPIMTELSEKLHVLTGLGSRGFVFAPLMAEDLVSKLCGDPSALSVKQRQAFGRERSPT